MAIWLLNENEMPGEEAHMLFFFFLSQCSIKGKEGIQYMNYDLTRLVAASGQVCFSFAVCSNFSSTSWESTMCSGQDVCSEIVVQLQLCLLEQETSLNSITIYPVH